MADRHPTVAARAIGANTGLNRARTAPSTNTTSSNVRRNLFQSHLTRRPTAPSSGTAGAGACDVRSGSTTSTSSSADTLRLGSIDLPDDASAPFATAESDIVIRDKNGEIELLEDPPTPAFDDHDVDGHGAASEHARLESEERQRLSEAVKQHQIDQNSLPAQPEELLEAVRGSLRAKVAALADDNWIYEREDPPRFQ